MHRCLLVFICLLQLSFSLVAADSLSPHFESININQGHINDILKDSEGYVWVATQDGLAKYNGVSWTQLNHNRKDSFSIADNYVWTLLEDDKGNIWAGTFEGNLCKYNKELNEFHCFSNKDAIGGVRLLHQYNHDTLIVGTDKGIYFFNLKDERYEYDSIFLSYQFKKGLNNAYSLVSIDDKNIIMNSSNGEYLFSIESKNITPIVFNQSKPISTTGFIKRYKNKFFVEDVNGIHLCEFDVKNKEFISEKYFFLTPKVGVTDIHPIEKNLILIASNSGLYSVNTTTQEVELIPNNNPLIDNGLNDKIIYCIQEIEDNLYWLGTKTAIYQFSTQPKRFKHILNDNLCNTSMLGMQEDNDGNLWIATRKGLARIKNFDQPEDKWEYFCYNKSNVSGLRNEYLLNVMFLENTLYLGYRRMGLSKFMVDEHDQLHLLAVNKTLDSLTQSWSVSQMEQDSKGVFWIATSGNGIIKWKVTTNKFEHIKKSSDKRYSLDHQYVFDFEELSKGRMSVATAGGISNIDIETNVVRNIQDDEANNNSLSGNFVMDFHKDVDDNSWVCTSGGLNLWLKDSTFLSWTKSEGLPNDVIYGMESYGNNRWISTNKGIVNVSFTKPSTINFRAYGIEDGILNSEHNQFSHYQAKSGLLLFGGKDGLTCFDPLKIINNPMKAIPKIESFKLFNEDASHLLEKTITYTDKIVLKYNQNFLSFELAALSYRNPNQNKFQYKMEGLNNEWFSLENRNYLSFNGLSPGNYTLYIKASNNDGVWNDAYQKLNIIIQKPIWNRWYAWLFYLGIVSSIIIYIYLMKINSIKKIALAKETERNRIRERSAKDFHDEAGTIITRLSLLTQFVKLQIGDKTEVKTALKQLEDNVQTLRAGMRDFIWVLDPSKDSLESTITRINQMGNNLFEHSAIAFELKSSTPNSKSIQLESNERRQLLLIVKEGINNVLKHSKATKCLIEINSDEQLCSLKLIDNGIGINPKVGQDGNGLRNLKQRAQKMNGTLTVKKHKLEGTILECNFPIHPNGL